MIRREPAVVIYYQNRKQTFNLKQEFPKNGVPGICRKPSSIHTVRLIEETTRIKGRFDRENLTLFFQVSSRYNDICAMSVVIERNFIRFPEILGESVPL